MSQPESATPKEESRYHHYTGNTIPWFVHLIWVIFWIIAIYYAVNWMWPTMQVEMLSPP